MTTIELQTEIQADQQLCFDLARSIDLHVESNARSREQAITGKTSGLAELGDKITWRARHFGIWLKMTVEIVSVKAPDSFKDVMRKGPFKRMEHIHEFRSINGRTLMVDRFSFQSPLGFIGKLVDQMILKRYMRNFLLAKNRLLKLRAEGGQD